MIADGTVPRVGVTLGSLWGRFGAPWCALGRFGVSLGLFGYPWACSGRFGVSLGRFGVILGRHRWLWVPLGTLLGHLGVTLRTLWCHFSYMKVSLGQLELTLKSL